MILGINSCHGVAFCPLILATVFTRFYKTSTTGDRILSCSREHGQQVALIGLYALSGMVARRKAGGSGKEFGEIYLTDRWIDGKFRARAEGITHRTPL
jgi:hypothetical protein